MEIAVNHVSNNTVEKMAEHSACFSAILQSAILAIYSTFYRELLYKYKGFIKYKGVFYGN